MCERVLSLLALAGYIGEFEIIDDHRAGKIVVNLTGRLNKVKFHEHSSDVWESLEAPVFIPIGKLFTDRF